MNGLKFGDRLAELSAFFGVRSGMIEGAPRQPHHLGPNADAAFVERLDGDFVALAGLAQNIGFGTPQLSRINSQVDEARSRVCPLCGRPKAGNWRSTMKAVMPRYPAAG